MSDGEVIQTGARGGIQRDGKIVELMLSINGQCAMSHTDLQDAQGKCGGQFGQLQTRGQRWRVFVGAARPIERLRN